jgi:feruloyl-CoA synthase
VLDARDGGLFARPRIVQTTLPDGTRLFRSTEELAEPARSVADLLRTAARAHPDRVLVAQRDPARAWRKRSYAEVLRQANGIGQALLDRGLGPHRPLIVLSGNSIDHLVITLGALTAGIPVAPLSVAYSLQSKDHRRLAEIRGLVSPGAVFADDLAAFGAALGIFDCERISSVDDLATEPGAALEDAFTAVTPDSVAKIMFTSGSTGVPKGVLTTHRMLCANQQMIKQVWPFLTEAPPVLVDWLPWNHVFGGNHNMTLVLANGGTLIIDDGRPTPALFAETITNLREIPPTVYFNVPAGYAQLVPVLEADHDFAERFFSRLRLLFNAGAALPVGLRDRLLAVSESVTGRQIPMSAGWGCTETAPAATHAHFPFTDARCIGVPLPGTEAKLVPVDEDRYEIRMRGPMVTPGYLRRPDLTSAAFDTDGFYRSGDAVSLLDDDDPNQGFIFRGRLTEDFKLTTGTFVRVGAVRAALLTAAPILADAVITGADRDHACALVWLNPTEIHTRLGPNATQQEIRDHLTQSLKTLNANATSSSRVDALLILTEPPNLDAGEITDKGYINQHKVLDRRAHLVDKLYTQHLEMNIVFE